MIAELQAEIADLRSQLDQIDNQSLDSWLTAMQRSGVAMRDFEASLSWRMTRPLRFLRRVQVAIGDVGVGGVTSIALGRLRGGHRQQ